MHTHCTRMHPHAHTCVRAYGQMLKHINESVAKAVLLAASETSKLREELEAKQNVAAGGHNSALDLVRAHVDEVLQQVKTQQQEHARESVRQAAALQTLEQLKVPQLETRANEVGCVCVCVA